MPQRIRMLIGFGDFPHGSFTHFISFFLKKNSMCIHRTTMKYGSLWWLLFKIHIFTTFWYVIRSSSSIIIVVVSLATVHFKCTFLFISTSPNTLPPVGNIIGFIVNWLCNVYAQKRYLSSLLWTLLTLANYYFVVFFFSSFFVL